MRSLRPTIDTKFHIDFSWWEKQNRDIRIYMLDHLCPECRENLESIPPTVKVDMVDPETAEVTKVDVVWEAIRACCGQQPGYIAPETPLLDGIFRVFLANGNRPLSVLELHELLNRRPPDTILRVLTKGRVFMGIRPV